MGTTTRSGGGARAPSASTAPSAGDAPTRATSEARAAGLWGDGLWEMYAAVYEMVKEQALLLGTAMCHRFVYGITVMIAVSADVRKVCFSRLPVLNAAECKHTPPLLFSRYAFTSLVSQSPSRSPIESKPSSTGSMLCIIMQVLKIFSLSIPSRTWKGRGSIRKRFFKMPKAHSTSFRTLAR